MHFILFPALLLKGKWSVAMADCLDRIYSNAYADYIFEYSGSPEFLDTYFQEDCVQIINERFAVAHLVRENNVLLQKFFERSVTYGMTPKCYGLMDTSSMDASGISGVSDSQIYGFRGNGCIICIIDTGIDYTAPVFMKEDGSSRIVGIWDQTLEAGPAPETFKYGAEYTKAEIDEALKADNPLTIVPSEDTIGHGTFLASVAAGNIVSAEDFRGAAPEADILVVKLKPAKPYLKWMFGIQDDRLAFQENDIMMGISYALRFARIRQQPISICIGLGTSSGAHEGENMLSRMVNYSSTLDNVFISVAAGNEGNARLHVQGSGERNTVEFNVGSDEEILAMELWGRAPDTYSVGFETPDGAVIDRIPPRFNAGEQINFAIGGTVLYVDYTLVEAQSGNELVFIWMNKPMPGLWKLNVYGEGTVSQQFNIWLPIRQYVSADTYFLAPNPDITLTAPSDGENGTAVTAYNHRNGSIYLESSRGFTADNRVKPDLAAPGVDILGVGRRGLYERRTGSSVAAAHVAGAACLMQQWSLDSPIYPLTGVQIRRYLIRGARRDQNIDWPSRIWGWGQLNLQEVFDALRRGL